MSAGLRFESPVSKVMEELREIGSDSARIRYNTSTKEIYLEPVKLAPSDLRKLELFGAYVDLDNGVAVEYYFGENYGTVLRLVKGVDERYVAKIIDAGVEVCIWKDGKVAVIDGEMGIGMGDKEMAPLLRRLGAEALEPVNGFVVTRNLLESIQSLEDSLDELRKDPWRGMATVLSVAAYDPAIVLRIARLGPVFPSRIFINEVIVYPKLSGYGFNPEMGVSIALPMVAVLADLLNSVGIKVSGVLPGDVELYRIAIGALASMAGVLSLRTKKPREIVDVTNSLLRKVFMKKLKTTEKLLSVVREMINAFLSDVYSRAIYELSMAKGVMDVKSLRPTGVDVKVLIPGSVPIYLLCLEFPYSVPEMEIGELTVSDNKLCIVV